jgi:hypothetical protein
MMVELEEPFVWAPEPESLEPYVWPDAGFELQMAANC